MSSQRGNTERRNRPQKYKNRFAFKNNLYDQTPQLKFINSIQVNEVCQHCKGVIEWKIKYKKYKPLSQAKTCIKCSERTVKKAYHVMCSACSRSLRCCAKCQQSWDNVQIEPPGPTRTEQLKLKAEMDRMVKLLPERKRRTFLRFMRKGKMEEETDPTVNVETTAISSAGDDHVNSEPKIKNFVPHTKEELLEKYNQINANEEEAAGDYDDDDLGSDEDYFDSNEDGGSDSGEDV